MTSIFLFIWQLPQNIVALIMYIFLFNKEKICERNYCKCYKAKNMNGGISLGNFAFVSEYTALHEYHVSHEVDGHTVQSKLLGPLYLFIIGFPSICWAMYRRYNMKKYPNYYSFYTEKWANNCAGLEDYERYDDYYDLRPKLSKN